MNKGIRNGYEDIDEVKDPDGIVAVVSRRRSNGTLAVGLFKEFERDGVQERTNFFGSKHFAAVRRVLEIVEERVRNLEVSTSAR